MMEQTAFFPYVENDLYQAVALPFQGATQGKGQIALMLLLPKSADNFSAMLEMMPDSFEESLSELQPRKVHVQLPKFSLSKRYPLNEPLMQLGMKTPFTTQANFSGIDGLLNLFLNKVVHETFFALDENGVTAAAATGASMEITAVPNAPAEFNADHPFLFFIVDLKSTEVLFIGKFADATDVI
jgi:serpin B